MKNDNAFLGTEPIGKLLFKLAIPTISAQLINMLYNVVDRIYIGHMAEVGDLALSADLQIITADGVSDETIDPTKTGRVTVVNFWGTWCTPCVNELPYFDQIARDYAGKVTVIAIHTDMVHSTAPAFIAEKYPDSPMVFAKDYVENNIEGYFTALGGQDAYPYTVILDENGVILEKFPYPLHYEDLQNALTPHLP